MGNAIRICVALTILLTVNPLWADWQRDPASDVDKEFISGNGGILPGVPGTDNTCWIAAASNMLAGAGYGNGATIQDRAEDIYLDFLVWQVALDPTNTHGARDGGWIDTALTWWLGSGNNVWPSNPYTVVTVFGNKTKTPWTNSNGAKYIGNQLRDYQQVGLSISWPRTSANGSPGGGHAVAAWGDDGFAADLTGNPGEVIIGDSDRDNGGDFQTYTYDSYTNPNPGNFNEGNGWYLNFSNNHWFIKHIATLTPTDNPINASDGPTQMVMGSYKIPQEELESATDLHYTAWTDYDILAYRTEIDWATNNDPVITESNTHVPSLTRSDIHADWDLTDNPVPFGKDVTITTQFILQNWNGIHYDDVYFTYPGGQETKYQQPPYVSPMGTDIRVDNHDKVERLLADDFLCIETGKISKVYLWGSWEFNTIKDPPPGNVRKFTLSFYSDDPVGDDPKNPEDDPTNTESKPLQLLWTGDFDQFTETSFAGVHDEYFWDPFTSVPLSWDGRIMQYVIDIPEEMAFTQRGTRSSPLVYWLGVSAEIEGERDVKFGWHSTDYKHGWNDKAVAWKDTFVLTDEFDYGEDRSSHSYKDGGAVSPGDYNCQTESLRLGNRDAGAFAKLVADVIPNTDEVKLQFRVPWSGTSGAALYVDGDYKGQVVGHDCSWQEILLTNMSADTADGKLEIELVDEIYNGYDGNIQVTYMQVLSLTMGWEALTYPVGHELRGQDVNMAFGIVTAANNLPGILMPQFGWNIVTAPVKEVDIMDITGGYVVGAFDVFDESGPSKLLGQYRFVHQYPHTQDPELHEFTIQGPDDQNGCEYRVTNFHFGHTYGCPDAESLWEFNDWMSSPVLSAYICNPDPVSIPINWEGLLPYPASDITPAHLIPDPPDCTVYFPGDINKDCCVNMDDFVILAADWLQCTTIY